MSADSRNFHEQNYYFVWKACEDMSTSKWRLDIIAVSHGSKVYVVSYNYYTGVNNSFLIKGVQ